MIHPFLIVHESMAMQQDLIEDGGTDSINMFGLYIYIISIYYIIYIYQT